MNRSETERARKRDDLLALWCGQAAALLEQRDAGALWHSLLAQTDRLLGR